MRIRLSDLSPELRAIAEQQIREQQGLPAPTKATRKCGKFDSKYEMIRDGELQALKAAGQIRDYRYHGITLLLAIGRRYTADFVVWCFDKSIILEETKGFWREKDRIRWEQAAHEYPMFRFEALTRKAGQWERETYKPR